MTGGSGDTGVIVENNNDNALATIDVYEVKEAIDIVDSSRKRFSQRN